MAPNTGVLNKVKRILSIDGGGLKGALPAAFLAEVEEATGKRAVDHFDLIAGTSTGGIIAIGLGLGIPARTILDFYIDEGPAAFRQDRPQLWALEKLYRAARRIRRAKYEPDRLKSALSSILGAARIGDSRTRLLIPAYDSNRRAVHVIKTAHHPRFERDWQLSAVDAALATAAAPTYLPQHALKNFIGLIDGGVWANNPCGLAAVEAAAVLKWNMAETKMLSLGCTETALVLRKSSGIRDTAAIIEVMMQGQSFGAEGTAMLLLDHPHSRTAFFRINPVMPAGYAGLDDASKLRDLAGLGCGEARTALPIIRREFLGAPTAPFVPCHLDRAAAE
jgi:patatin-like phospholipase/acyl hydrolase